jgi:hypothetical protein
MSEKDKMMGITVSAKPIQWEESAPYPDGVTEWTEDQYGFHIRHDPSEDDDYRYAAAWGEGDTEHFGSIEEAQAWCQSEIDGWVAHICVIDQAAPKAPQQVSNTPQDGKSGWTEAPVGEWYWILRDSVDGPMWSPAFKDKYHRWCSGDWLNGVEAIQVGPKIAPPQQQEQSGEAVEWQGPRELQIDSYMTGREGVHAFVNAKAIHLEYTDGGYCWALLLPVPTRRNKSLRASPTTPTSTAIAAMVIRQALELCNQILPKDYNNSDFATGQIAANNAIVAGLRALTPANAEAELEALMMKVAEEVQKATVKAGVFSTAPTPEERRAIVRRILDEKGE